MQDKSRTLRRRLTWLIVCVVGLAVTPIAGILAWRDGERDISAQTERLRAEARVVASLAADAVAQGDRQGAFHALRSIARMQDVEYGRIERPAGELVVETGAGARLISDVQAGQDTHEPSILTRLFSRTSEVSVPVVFGAREVGHVVLLGRTEGMLKRFLVSLGESLAVAAAAILVGLLIAWRLQERIARPILALTEAMRGVHRTHDFGRTVSVTADGEVKALVDGFNDMLSEIRIRDGLIAAQMAGLEREVQARTAELVVARDLAESANSAKSDFLATMSHEIRTPMNGVMVMAEILAAGELPPRERRFAEVIAKSGVGLIAIINDILDYSKVEAGKLQLESIPVDPSEIVDDVLSLFWDQAQSKGLDLAGFVDPATPQQIAGDPVRLRQVISNLVNNAIKFTETGGVLIEIAPDEGGAIRIAVQDTGIGIPEDEIGSVFGAFTQADRSTTRRFGGTGLGLAICKKLVDAMGGELRVTSQVGEGTCFAFVLSAPVLKPAAPWPVALAPDAGAAVAHAGIFTRRILSSYFKRAGYAVANGGEVSIAIGSPAGLRALTGPPEHMICLGTYGDSEARELLRDGSVEAVLPQPIRRQELALLLHRLETGAPLQNPSDLSGSAAHSSDVLPTFAGSRVLVADDSAVNREVAMEALRRLGIEVKLVAEGSAAVAAAGAERFDAVLMDGDMPRMDGYDATREIRRLEQAHAGPSLPIIALTAHVVGAAADEWRGAGMDAVLHKPFTLKALAETLSRFLVPAATGRPAASPPTPPASTALSILRRREDLFDVQVVTQLEGFAAGGRSDFVDKVLRLYRENAPGCIDDMHAAAEAGEADNVARAMHALKSMSYNIGAKAVAAAAAAIETAGANGTIPDQAAMQPVWARLNDTLDALGVLTATVP